LIRATLQAANPNWYWRIAASWECGAHTSRKAALGATDGMPGMLHRNYVNFTSIYAMKSTTSIP